MMFHAVAKHIQTNRHKRLHTRAATAIVQATQWEQEPYHKTIANRTRHHIFSCTQEVSDDDLERLAVRIRAWTPAA